MEFTHRTSDHAHRFQRVIDSLPSIWVGISVIILFVCEYILLIAWLEDTIHGLMLFVFPLVSIVAYAYLDENNFTDSGFALGGCLIATIGMCATALALESLQVQTRKNEIRITSIGTVIPPRGTTTRGVYIPRSHTISLKQRVTSTYRVHDHVDYSKSVDITMVTEVSLIPEKLPADFARTIYSHSGNPTVTNRLHALVHSQMHKRIFADRTTWEHGLPPRELETGVPWLTPAKVISVQIEYVK